MGSASATAERNDVEADRSRADDYYWVGGAAIGQPRRSG